MLRGRRLALPLMVAAVPLATIALASTVTLITPQCSLAGSVAASAGGWVTTGATEDPTYTGGAYQSYYNNGLSYAELGATPGYPNYVRRTAGKGARPPQRTVRTPRRVPNPGPARRVHLAGDPNPEIRHRLRPSRATLTTRSI